MINDLVRRLRYYAGLNNAVFNPWLYGNAADRIEQLEAALREILSNNPIRGDTGSSTLKEIVEAMLKSSVIARAALGEKKR